MVKPTRAAARRQCAPDFNRGISSGWVGAAALSRAPSAEFSGASQAGAGVPGNNSCQSRFKSASVRQERFAIKNNMGTRAAVRQGSVEMPIRLPPSGDDQHGDINQQAGAKHPHPVLARQPKQVAISNKPIQHDLAYVPEREPRRQCRRRRRHIL